MVDPTNTGTAIDWLKDLKSKQASKAFDAAVKKQENMSTTTPAEGGK